MALLKFTKFLLASVARSKSLTKSNTGVVTPILMTLSKASCASILSTPPPIRRGSETLQTQAPAHPLGACTTLATTNQPIELIAFIAALVEKFQYQPATTLEEGVKGFVAWYRNVFKLI
jgi:hypothetical protein